MRTRYTKFDYTPIFILVAVLSITLLTRFLPASVFGSEIGTLGVELWSYAPYFIVFAIAIQVVVLLMRSR